MSFAIALEFMMKVCSTLTVCTSLSKLFPVPLEDAQALLDRACTILNRYNRLFMGRRNRRSVRPWRHTGRKGLLERSPAGLWRPVGSAQPFTGLAPVIDTGKESILPLRVQPRLLHTVTC